MSAIQPVTSRASIRARVVAWLREPLLQFTVLGGGLFLAWPLVADKVAPPQNRIDISAGQMQRAIDYFYQTHLRLPDAGELQPLVEEEIQTEVAFREGMALGLDRDDEIIRRRIKQKLEFMTEDIVDQTKPDDAQLQQFLDQHRDSFGASEQIAFSQIYLNPDRHAATLDTDAARLLARLNSADGRLDYGTDSDVLPVPNDFEATPLDAVAGMFGAEFADALSRQPTGHWVGPIRSGYGVHLVLVRQVRQGKPPQLADVRDQVLREWQAARRTEANQEVYRRMRAKYAISVQMPPILAPSQGPPSQGAPSVADDGLPATGRTVSR